MGGGRTQTQDLLYDNPPAQWLLKPSLGLGGGDRGQYVSFYSNTAGSYLKVKGGQYLKIYYPKEIKKYFKVLLHLGFISAEARARPRQKKWRQHGKSLNLNLDQINAKIITEVFFFGNLISH